MNWQIEQSGFASITGLDTRAAWLLNDSSSDYLKSEEHLIPFVVRISPEKDELASQVIGELVGANVIYVSSWYLTESLVRGERTIRYPKSGAVFVAYAGKRFFDLLAGIEKSELFRSLNLSVLQGAAKSIELRTPLLRAQPDLLSFGDPRLNQGDAFDDRVLKKLQPQVNEWSEDTVVMAVIDDGVPIANTRFQNQSGTRIEHFWRQDGANTSASVPTGAELNRSEINNLLSASEVAGIVDEDTFYRRAGLASFTESGGVHKSVAWRASHGAHVMDMATGFAKDKDVLNRPVVAVQLPASVVEDTSGSELDHHVIEAIEYILQRAELIAPGKSLPVVINLSFGRYAGPHDGSSVLEKYLDQVVIDRPNTRIVLPAGNSRQERCHSVISKQDLTDNQGEVTLTWRVQPDDRTHSSLQLWLPLDSSFNPPTSDRIRISVIAPNGDESPELGEIPGQGDLVYLVKGETVCRVNSSFITDDTRRCLFQLSLMPTSRNENLDGSNGRLAVAPAGDWRIIVKDINLPATADINAWIERDDTAYSYQSRGRQSYFDSENYKKFDDSFVPIEFDPNSDSTTRRQGTINGIATGDKTIVVGAMYGKERTVTEYSSCGPGSESFDTSVATRMGPDLLTVSDDSKVHRGVPGCGTRSGSVVYFNGSSVAAPRVAREIADLLVAGGDADRTQLAQIVNSQDPLSGTNGECSGSGRWDLRHPHDSPYRTDKEEVGIT